MKPSRRQGFTLIELLIIIAILAVLMAIVYPRLVVAKQMSKFSHNFSNIQDPAGFEQFENRYCDISVLNTILTPVVQYNSLYDYNGKSQGICYIFYHMNVKSIVYMRVISKWNGFELIDPRVKEIYAFKPIPIDTCDGLYISYIEVSQWDTDPQKIQLEVLVDDTETETRLLLKDGNWSVISTKASPHRSIISSPEKEAQE